MSVYTIGDGPVSDYDLIRLLATVLQSRTGLHHDSHDRKMLDGGCSVCRALDLAADRAARRLLELDANWLADDRTNIIGTEEDA